MKSPLARPQITGQRIKELLGAWGYEYYATVPVAYKDSVSLHAINEFGGDDMLPRGGRSAVRAVQCLRQAAADVEAHGDDSCNASSAITGCRFNAS